MSPLKIGALLMTPNDDVAVLFDDAQPGDQVETSDGRFVMALEAIPQGHKVAVRKIAAGQPILKYGSAIGLATTAIESGAHVHVHNVESRRMRGDE